MLRAKANRYHSFLIRLWEDSEGRQFIMLERITPPKERFYFSSLDDLFLYLMEREGSTPDAAGAGAGEQG